jgi:hypothetical protein
MKINLQNYSFLPGKSPLVVCIPAAVPDTWATQGIAYDAGPGYLKLQNTWARSIRKAFDLYEDASWRELALGIKPGNSRASADQQRMETPIAAWDVFRTALLWRIWCARCKIVFKTDPCTVIQTSHLAWSDTIHAGMARLRHLKSTYLLRNDNGKRSARQDFENTWCRSNVFCAGIFSSVETYSGSHSRSSVSHRDLCPLIGRLLLVLISRNLTPHFNYKRKEGGPPDSRCNGAEVARQTSRNLEGTVDFSATYKLIPPSSECSAAESTTETYELLSLNLC